MFTEKLGIADDPLGTFLFLTVTGYTFYLLMAIVSYLVFFRWKRRRFNPDYVPDWAENKKAIRLAFFSIMGNAVVTAPIHVLIATGYSRVYFDVNDHGWGWLLLTIPMMLVITETLVYWAHRVLHMGALYTKLHSYHHEFQRPTPFVAVAFHPADSFMQALPHHLCAFLFPVHIWVYLGSVMLVTVWAVVIHDRVTLVRHPAINYTEHHTIHHWYYDYNYGQYTTFWDRICGTYRSPQDRELWPPRSDPAGP